MKKNGALYHFRVYRKPATTFGLKYSPYLVLGNDDAEEVADLLPDPSPTEEWDMAQRRLLIATVKALRHNATIVEIGVHKPENGLNSSTQVIMQSRAETMNYIGFDWQDRTSLFAGKSNIHIVVANTRDIKAVEGSLDSLGASEIDLLVIDGGRSVNQVLCDWMLAGRVKKGGFVVLHGNAVYPGPFVLTRAINPQHFQQLVLDEQGLGIAIYERV